MTSQTKNNTYLYLSLSKMKTNLHLLPFAKKASTWAHRTIVYELVCMFANQMQLVSSFLEKLYATIFTRMQRYFGVHLALVLPAHARSSERFVAEFTFEWFGTGVQHFVYLVVIFIDKRASTLVTYVVRFLCINRLKYFKLLTSWQQLTFVCLAAMCRRIVQATLKPFPQ